MCLYALSTGGKAHKHNQTTAEGVFGRVSAAALHSSAESKSSRCFRRCQEIAPVLDGKLQEFKCGERVNNTAAIPGKCGM
jgi:hypothetical protein